MTRCSSARGQVGRGATLRPLLYGLAPRQEIETGQQFRFLQHQQDIAGFGRLEPLLVVLVVLFFGPLTLVKGAALRLTADVGETVHALALRVAHEMQLAVKEVIVFQRHGALGVKDEGRGTMHPAHPGDEIVGINAPSRRGQRNAHAAANG